MSSVENFPGPDNHVYEGEIVDPVTPDPTTPPTGEAPTPAPDPAAAETAEQLKKANAALGEIYKAIGETRGSVDQVGDAVKTTGQGVSDAVKTTGQRVTDAVTHLGGTIQTGNEQLQEGIGGVQQTLGALVDRLSPRQPAGGDSLAELRARQRQIDAYTAPYQRKYARDTADKLGKKGGKNEKLRTELEGLRERIDQKELRAFNAELEQEGLPPITDPIDWVYRQVVRLPLAERSTAKDTLLRDLGSIISEPKAIEPRRAIYDRGTEQRKDKKRNWVSRVIGGRAVQAYCLAIAPEIMGDALLDWGWSQQGAMRVLGVPAQALGYVAKATAKMDHASDNRWGEDAIRRLLTGPLRPTNIGILDTRGRTLERDSLIGKVRNKQGFPYN